MVPPFAPIGYLSYEGANLCCSGGLEVASGGGVQMFRDIARKLRLHLGHLSGISQSLGTQLPPILTRCQIISKYHHPMAIRDPRWRMGSHNREPQLRLWARVFHRVAGDGVSE
jgi:hypothetical protein